MKCLGIGLGIVSGKGNEPRVVIDQDAQLSWGCLAADREDRAGGEVHHPEVVDVRGLESFGGAGFQPTRAQALAIQALAAQIAVQHADGGQRTLLLLPMGVEDLEGDGGVLGHLLQHPGGGRFIQHAALALIGARRRYQGGKAALFMGIPPVFDRARGIVIAVFVRPGMERGLAQGLG